MICSPYSHTMLANAVQICDAKFGNLLLFEDGAFRTVAQHGAPQPYLELRQREPVIQPQPGSDLDQLVKTKQIVHVPDLRVKGIASGSAFMKLAGARTMLNVPMVKESELVGAITIYPARSPPVHRQADFAVAEFRQSSSHCYRKCTTTKGIARENPTSWKCSHRRLLS